MGLRMCPGIWGTPAPARRVLRLGGSGPVVGLLNSRRSSLRELGHPHVDDPAGRYLYWGGGALLYFHCLGSTAIARQSQVIGGVPAFGILQGPLNSQPHSLIPSQRASLAQQLHTISHTIFRLTRRSCTCLAGTLPQSSKYTPRFSKCLVVNSGVVCALTLMRRKLQLWFKIHGPQRSLGSAAHRAPCPGSKISCDH